MNEHHANTRFCGIDVAKTKHVACVIDRDGAFIARSQAFANDADGFDCLFTRLEDAGGARHVLVGMEATGHYWFSLHEALVQAGYEVVVLNPLQTKQQAKKAIRKCKTDKIDARHIATILKNGEHRPTVIPGDLAMTCRWLTRHRQTIVRQQTRIKLLLRARLHPIWPEYETLFANPLCKTGRKILLAAPTPTDLRAIDPDALVDLVRTASRGRLGNDLAERLRCAAERSVGIHRGLEGARIGIRSLLTQIENLQPALKDIEDQIVAVAEHLPGHVFTLPGAQVPSAVSVYAETDPIDTFRTADQLVAFAGLDTVVFQTGGYQDCRRRRISKRGSPFLRQTLWLMARQACLTEGDLRDYYLRRKRQGLHHLSAVTATALKLTRIVWRILTDRRDYVPAQPTSTT
jgi:transposase